MAGGKRRKTALVPRAGARRKLRGRHPCVRAHGVWRSRSYLSSLGEIPFGVAAVAFCCFEAGVADIAFNPDVRFGVADVGFTFDAEAAADAPDATDD